MSTNRPKGVTLGQFAVSFVPAGLLLVAALLWPEMTRELDLNRTRYTIWLTTLLLIPALTLYPFRSASGPTANLADLFWTWTYAVYLVHAFWAVFVIFDGIADSFRQQGTAIAGVNFFLTGLWTLDVALLWLGWSPGWFRVAARLFTFLVFAVTLLFLREGAVWWLGAAFAAAVVAALTIRLFATTRSVAAAA